jgi:hypothetical protein
MANFNKRQAVRADDGSLHSRLERLEDRVVLSKLQAKTTLETAAVKLKTARTLPAASRCTRP